MNLETAKLHRLIGIKRALKFGTYSTGHQNMLNKYSPKLNNAIAEYFRRANNGMSVQEIADINGISRQTIYNKLKQYHNYWYNRQYVLNPNCSPFLRGYIGNKSSIVTIIENLMPKQFNNYLELFAGSGSLLFATQPRRAVINDIDRDVMNCYRVIRDKAVPLIQKLKDYHHHWNQHQYYYIRKQLNHHRNTTNNVDRVAQVIYFQATSFYGLVRNRNAATKLYTGHYRFRDADINKLCTIIKADSEYLRNNKVELFNEDFKRVAKLAHSHDFVFIDPPYYTNSKYDNSLYYSNDFNDANQYQLYKLCQKLTNKGVKFIETNTDAEFIRNLYQSFKLIPIKQQRNLRSRRVSEYGQLIIKNY